MSFDIRGVTLRGQQREILDYMRDVYRIEDIRVRPGGKHLHIEYVYEGKRHKDTMPRGSGSSDHGNWIDTRKHDLRRVLGDPPPPLTEKPKRTLDDMTNELQTKSDLLTGTALGAVLDPPRPVITGTGKTTTAPPPIKQKQFAINIGTTHGANRTGGDIVFYMTKELVEAMERQFGKDRHWITTYHYPVTWTIRPSREAGRAIEPGRFRLRASGGDALKKLGHFPSMGAKALIRHNRVELSLDMIPEKILFGIEAAHTPAEPIPAEPVESLEDLGLAPPQQAMVVHEEPVVQPIVPVIPPIPQPAEPPPPAPPADPRERLRHVLRLIKQVEDEGTYRLIPDNNGWRWRANDIVLEDC